MARLREPEPGVRRVALLDLLADSARRPLDASELTALTDLLGEEHVANVRIMFVRLFASAWRHADRSDAVQRWAWDAVAQFFEKEYAKTSVDAASAIAGIRLADAVRSG